VSAPDPRIARARNELLAGVGEELASSFPGITRLGGQIVAALFLSERGLSMDELCEELGRSKSNVFTNLKGLEAIGIVRRRREGGVRRDMYALKGNYPDVVVGAYIARLRSVVADKRTLARRALSLLGDATGAEADRIRARLDEIIRKYDSFALLMTDLPDIDGPIDLAQVIAQIPPELLDAMKRAVASAWATPS
jgi:DNA-binding transcriptional regulator GbsR (MarR family)